LALPRASVSNRNRLNQLRQGIDQSNAPGGLRQLTAV